MANGLDGKTWTRYSISVWNDLRKVGPESSLRHPAMFPLALPPRLIECLTMPGDGCVLDPFAGAGSTLLAAYQAGKRGLGIELSPEYVSLARQRFEELAASGPAPTGGSFQVVQGDAAAMPSLAEP